MITHFDTQLSSAGLLYESAKAYAGSAEVSLDWSSRAADIHAKAMAIDTCHTEVW